MRERFAAAGACLALAGGLLLSSGCQHGMEVQPRYKPLEPSHFFGDDRSARPLVQGTVARGQLHTDELFYTGMVNRKLADVFPFPVTRDVLERGRERFNIYCSPCHGQLGNGQGMIVQRGFRPPPSLHLDRLRKAPAGHFFDVMTNGFGVMPSYASRVSPRDRWAIAAYIRALQLSQGASVNEVPEDQRKQFAGAEK